MSTKRTVQRRQNVHRMSNIHNEYTRYYERNGRKMHIVDAKLLRLFEKL